MTSDSSPFFASKIECPVCGYLNSFEIIKQGSYVESGKDTDFAPLGRIWKDGAFQRYNPLLYFVGTCKNCYYTREINSAYKNWQSDNGFKTYRLPIQKKKHLKEVSDANGIVKMLGKNIDYKNNPNETTIIKLLLATFDELLLDRSISLDLARYYLRIAWIYREMPNADGGCGFSHNLIPAKIQAEIRSLKEGIDGFGDRIMALVKTIDEESILFSPEDRPEKEVLPEIKRIANKMPEIWNMVQKSFDELQTEYGKIKIEVDQSRPDEKGEKSFSDYPSFGDFLYKAREKWQGIPVNESEALNFALKYYLKAYQNSKEIKPGLQQLQASYMIAELSRRVGDNNQALEYYKTTSRQAHEMIVHNRNDSAIFANAQKILEMSLDQARLLKKPERVKT